MKYKLYNTKTKCFVQELKHNFINSCGVSSCGYHLEDVVFETKIKALKDLKRRISYKDLIIVEV